MRSGERQLQRNELPFAMIVFSIVGYLSRTTKSGEARK